MKIKSLFFAALVLMSAVAFGAGKDDPRSIGMAVVPVKGSEIFKVIYKGETTGKVKLTIYNSSAKVILSETFNNLDGFICPLNFSGLKYGEYTIELVDGSGKRIEKINYQPQQSTKFVHISKIKNTDSKYLLSVISPTGSSTVRVNIFDSEDNLIHTETKEVSGEFAQVYKLENPSPSYTFEVSDSTGNIKTVRF